MDVDRPTSGGWRSFIFLPTKHIVTDRDRVGGAVGRGFSIGARSFGTSSTMETIRIPRLVSVVTDLSIYRVSFRFVPFQPIEPIGTHRDRAGQQNRTEQNRAHNPRNSKHRSVSFRLRKGVQFRRTTLPLQGNKERMND